jgi:hypothetical protein
LSDYHRRSKSVRKAIERYQGALALWATWEDCKDIDPEYLRHLKKKVDKMRQELKYKNVL